MAWAIASRGKNLLTASRRLVAAPLRSLTLKLTLAFALVGLIGVLDADSWKLADRTQLHLLSWLKTPVVMPDGSILVLAAARRPSATRMAPGRGCRWTSESLLSVLEKTAVQDRRFFLPSSGLPSSLACRGHHCRLSKAIVRMIVHQPGGLHEGIHDGRADKLEAATFQFRTQAV